MSILAKPVTIPAKSQGVYMPYMIRQERTLEFMGLNQKSVIEDGEMRDMYNLSSDEYPCLYQRKARSVFADNFKYPTNMMSKNEKLAVISRESIGEHTFFLFYYGEDVYPELELSENTQMVAINSKILFFPEKMYFDIKSKDVGSLEAHVQYANATLTVSKSSISFPSENPDFLYFNAGDAVSVEASGTGAEGLNVSAVIESVTSNSITFPNETFLDILSASNATEKSVSVTKIEITRKCPDLDYVLEVNNRLWGVSNADNTIYACKLGDPTNWFYYQGTGLDSYAAEQGTDGEWTGCAAYSGHILFFKEDYVCRLYGSLPSNFQTSNMECHGVEKGSGRSIAIINDVVFYKSRVGIMAYAGGTPSLISDNFGSGKYENAVAGTDRFKYYVSILHDGKPELLVYDLSKMLWHKEDNARARCFSFHDGMLLFIDEAKNIIYRMNADTAETEKIEWLAQLGPFDEFLENTKIYSKIKMRMHLAKDSELEIAISVDDGEWEPTDEISCNEERTLDVPIAPRRCNRFGIRIKGKGYCKIESIVRQFRQGRK